MSKVILNNGIDQLYNPIYCNMLNTNDGIIQCQNCGFDNIGGGSIIPYLDPKSSNGEQSCLSDCKKDIRCTAYTYTSASETPCQFYTGMPNNINYNMPGSNSGYDVKKYNYDYTNLSSSQKNNVRKKCANQYLNNIIINSNNINKKKIERFDNKVNLSTLDLSKCLNVDNINSNITSFDLKPSCFYNILEENNILPEDHIINNITYNVSSENPLKDPDLEKYIKNYDTYNTNEINVKNINNKLSANDGKDTRYNNIVRDTMNTNINNNYISSINNKQEDINKISNHVLDNLKSKNDSNMDNSIIYTNNDVNSFYQFILNSLVNLERFNNGSITRENNIYFNILRIIIFIIIIVIISILLFYTLRKIKK